ncbi:uncharacterized protein EHS24_005632 [Apiotrichum porosum]|uniref:Uncharacterized protein n=1 Tax=Apiotrichum porosum TaxID=105984 RepID=A0A427XZ55_9TREE|nr:uncharacterized protein EHS24_005632 [Apiotrichum porosum]RSH84129.1 hypothetical protein EHS24_005632 [Apiotrichum porosum]
MTHNAKLNLDHRVRAYGGLTRSSSQYQQYQTPRYAFSSHLHGTWYGPSAPHFRVIARPQGTEWEQHDLLEIGKAEQKDVDEEDTGIGLLEVKGRTFLNPTEAPARSSDRAEALFTSNHAGSTSHDARPSARCWTADALVVWRASGATHGEAA